MLTTEAVEPSISGILFGAKGIAMLTTEAVEPSISGILFGAKGIAMLTTEAVEPSISGSEIGAKEARCLQPRRWRHQLAVARLGKGGAMLKLGQLDPISHRYLVRCQRNRDA